MKQFRGDLFCQSTAFSYFTLPGIHASLFQQTIVLFCNFAAETIVGRNMMAA